MLKFLLVASLLMPALTVAEGMEEIVVTAHKRSEALPDPSVFLRRNADFMLLQVEVNNDTRDEEQRADEIHATLKNFLDAAAKQRNIEVSLITENDLVVPLTEQNYRIRVLPGKRVDTSSVYISVKTPIATDARDGQTLINKLQSFVGSIKVVGRTELDADRDVDISVVGPAQYRNQIISRFAEDVKSVTSALGPDYRVVVEGIDGPVYWYRISQLELGLYIPYRYLVLPNSVNAVSITHEY